MKKYAKTSNRFLLTGFTMFKNLYLALVLTAFGSAAASAAPVNPLLGLEDFNAVIFTNASTPSDIEGAAVIGGNFSGATVYNNPGSATPAGYGALTVFGNTSGNPINVDNGGSAYIGGSKGAIINLNGGGKYLPAPPNDIADFQTAFTTFSQSLSTLTPTSALPTTGNNELITATPGKNGVAVFDVTAAELDSIPSYQIAVNGAKSIVFNVSGTSINFSANDESGITGAGDIIWNFYQAKSVTLGTQIAGSVIAPLANVTNNNQIDGALVANSWTGSGELHDDPYTGASPLPPTTVSAAPEPSTWALTLMGIGALGLMLRRARRAAEDGCNEEAVA
jgi:choice-of-anchor A domain-containing protein